jgi:hypothetical protein
MRIMQQALPQREYMYTNVYQYIHATFLNDSRKRFGFTTVREANISGFYGHW